MSTVVRGYWFKSDLFPIEPEEDKATFPGCYGKALAAWLAAKLTERGYPVEPVIAEDFGWCVMCSRDRFLLFVGCGAMPLERDTEGVPSAEEIVWHAFPALELGVNLLSRLRKLLGALDTATPLLELDEDLRAILTEEPRITFCAEP